MFENKYYKIISCTALSSVPLHTFGSDITGHFSTSFTLAHVFEWTAQCPAFSVSGSPRWDSPVSVGTSSRVPSPCLRPGSPRHPPGRSSVSSSELAGQKWTAPMTSEESPALCPCCQRTAPLEGPHCCHRQGTGFCCSPHSPCFLHSTAPPAGSPCRDEALAVERRSIVCDRTTAHTHS